MGSFDFTWFPLTFSLILLLITRDMILVIQIGYPSRDRFNPKRKGYTCICTFLAQTQITLKDIWYQDFCWFQQIDVSRTKTEFDDKKDGTLIQTTYLKFENFDQSEAAIYICKRYIGGTLTTSNTINIKWIRKIIVSFFYFDISLSIKIHNFELTV